MAVSPPHAHILPPSDSGPHSSSTTTLPNSGPSGAHASPSPVPKEPLAASRFYSFPPSFTLQPTLSTRQSQLRSWSALIQRYCAYHRLFDLSLPAVLLTPLFHNATIHKRLSHAGAVAVFAYMASDAGGRRAEWADGKGPQLHPSVSSANGLTAERATSGAASSYTGSIWIYWKRPEEWADSIAGWVEETGQKGVVLTLYELTEGEGTSKQEFYQMPAELLRKVLGLLVGRGKAQVFGTEGEQGVKFF